MDAAIACLEALGRRAAPDVENAVKPLSVLTPDTMGRTDAIRCAMTAIAGYERTLSAALLDAATSIAGLTVHGVTDRARLSERVPTLCFSVAGAAAGAVAEGLSTTG